MPPKSKPLPEASSIPLLPPRTRSETKNTDTKQDDLEEATTGGKQDSPEEKFADAEQSSGESDLTNSGLEETIISNSPSSEVKQSHLVEVSPTPPQQQQQQPDGSSRNAEINMANDDEANAANASTNCRLPLFWRSLPQLSFYQVQSVLEAAGVQADRTRYNLAVDALDPETLADISDLLARPPEENRYATLKARIHRLCRQTTPEDAERAGARRPETLSIYATHAHPGGHHGY